MTRRSPPIAALTLLLAGCPSEPPPGVPPHTLPTPGPRPPAVPPAPATPCAALTSADCMRSRGCVLDQPVPRGGYLCREPRHACERDLPLAIGREPNPTLETDCAARPGCRLEPGQCFCGVAILGLGQCACGGGPPPRCVPASEPPALCPEPNPLAAYLRGAERQAETDAQRANVRAALTDLAFADTATLRGRRYGDYQGDPGRWDLATLLTRHFVPATPRTLPAGDALYACAAAPEVRTLASQMLAALP